MANVPAHTVNRFSFGPGIIYIGVEGATPTLDIGAVKGDAELIVSRTPLEVKQGSPQTLVKQYVVEEKVTLRSTSIEWNLDNLPYLIGAGVTTQVGALDTLNFGGDQNINERAVRFLHILPSGSTIDVQLHRAQAIGDINISLKETDIHEIPFEFAALEGNTNFEGAAPAVNQKLFRILHTRV